MIDGSRTLIAVCGRRHPLCVFGHRWRFTCAPGRAAPEGRVQRRKPARRGTIDHGRGRRTGNSATRRPRARAFRRKSMSDLHNRCLDAFPSGSARCPATRELSALLDRACRKRRAATWPAASATFKSLDHHPRRHRGSSFLDATPRVRRRPSRSNGRGAREHAIHAPRARRRSCRSCSADYARLEVRRGPTLCNAARMHGRRDPRGRARCSHQPRAGRAGAERPPAPRREEHHQASRSSAPSCRRERALRAPPRCSLTRGPLRAGSPCLRLREQEKHPARAATAQQ
jgi:hypothetical protein